MLTPKAGYLLQDLTKGRKFPMRTWNHSKNIAKDTAQGKGKLPGPESGATMGV